MPRVPLCTPPARFVNEAVEFSKSSSHIHGSGYFAAPPFMVVLMAHRACDCHYFFFALSCGSPCIRYDTGITILGRKSHHLASVANLIRPRYDALTASRAKFFFLFRYRWKMRRMQTLPNCHLAIMWRPSSGMHTRWRLTYPEGNKT